MMQCDSLIRLQTENDGGLSMSALMTEGNQEIVRVSKDNQMFVIKEYVPEEKREVVVLCKKVAWNIDKKEAMKYDVDIEKMNYEFNSKLYSSNNLNTSQLSNSADDFPTSKFDASDDGDGDNNASDNYYAELC